MGTHVTIVKVALDIPPSSKRSAKATTPLPEAILSTTLCAKSLAPGVKGLNGLRHRFRLAAKHSPAHETIETELKLINGRTSCAKVLEGKGIVDHLIIFMFLVESHAFIIYRIAFLYQISSLARKHVLDSWHPQNCPKVPVYTQKNASRARASDLGLVIISFILLQSPHVLPTCA